ncbi:MAG: HD domain-containing protein [Desulfobacterales bacterium]|nr:HD domain-containing protein [Desulfobacterales bacterium]MBF0397679.1 HD domain-containing protein [Desulfobacterales bacterium]
MLINTDNVKEKYNLLFEKISKRKEQVMKFKNFLENETNWLRAPASTRFHLNVEQGLLIHSVGVTYNALDIKTLLAPDITDESVVITALFHDLGKVGYAGKPYYLPNDNAKDIEKGITFKKNPEIVTMNLAVRSLYLISQHISLSEEEAQAIVAHDGLYAIKGGVVNIDYHHNECRLQMILHFADKWTSAVQEEGRK